MFWLDDELGSDLYLDGIITVVDSKYYFKHLTESNDLKAQKGELTGKQENSIEVFHSQLLHIFSLQSVWWWGSYLSFYES